MNLEINPTPKQLSFSYGDEVIAFDRRPRQTNGNVLIKVHADCRIVVSAPEDTNNEAVLAAVKKRSRWIYEQLREFRKQLEHVTPRKYVSGESHYYLGKQYLLKVNIAPEQPQGVKLLRGSLEVTVKQKDTVKVSSLLTDWYKNRAKEVFAKRLDVLLEQTLWVESRPPIHIRTMKTQWGSCSPNGRLTINPQLVKAPRDCIDYVILHELCHLAEHNHSERFYRLMNQVMPKWEKVKERLDGMASKLLEFPPPL